MNFQYHIAISFAFPHELLILIVFVAVLTVTLGIFGRKQSVSYWLLHQLFFGNFRSKVKPVSYCINYLTPLSCESQNCNDLRQYQFRWIWLYPPFNIHMHACFSFFSRKTISSIRVQRSHILQQVCQQAVNKLCSHCQCPKLSTSLEQFVNMQL